MNSAIGHSWHENIWRDGDTVVAVRDLGKRTWCSGVPAGAVGVVVDIDWLGDLRVVFTIDGDWFGGRTMVEKVVPECDVRPVNRVERRLTGT